MRSRPLRWLVMGAVVQCLAGTPAALAKTAETIRIAVDVPYAPMEYRKPSGALTGFDIDLGHALCEAARLHCVWVIQNWAGMVPGLLARKFDAVMSTMAVTDRRARVVRFTEPYMTLDSAWFIKAAAPPEAITPAYLNGKRIGVQRGTIQDSYVTDRFGSSATIRRYTTADDLATDMDVGRLDAVFITAITGHQIFPGPATATDTGIHAVPPVPAFGQPIAIATRPNAQALRDEFNRALQQIKSDGTYARIRARYFQQ